MSADAETVALAAVQAFLEQVNGTDDVLAAAARLNAAAPPPSETAAAARARGRTNLSGRTGYVKSGEGSKVPGREGGRSFDRGGDDADSFYGGGGGGGDRFRDRGRSSFEDRFDPQQRKDGDWDCPDCGFMNFASRSSCFKCGDNNNAGYAGRGRGRGPIEPYDASGRENRDGRELRDGDWRCPDCGFNNFASRTVCKRCTEGDRGGGYGRGGGGYGEGGAEVLLVISHLSTHVYKACYARHYLFL